MPAVIAAFLCPLFHAVSNIIDAHLSNNVFRKLPTLIFYNCLTNFFAAPIGFGFRTAAMVRMGDYAAAGSCRHDRRFLPDTLL